MTLGQRPSRRPVILSQVGLDLGIYETRDLLRVRRRGHGGATPPAGQTSSLVPRRSISLDSDASLRPTLSARSTVGAKTGSTTCRRSPRNASDASDGALSVFG